MFIIDPSLICSAHVRCRRLQLERGQRFHAPKMEAPTFSGYNRLASFSVSLCFHTFCLIIALDGIIDVDKVSVCHKTLMWPPELRQCTAGTNSALAFRGRVIVLWLWHVCGFSSYLLCVAYFFFFLQIEFVRFKSLCGYSQRKHSCPPSSLKAPHR